MLCYFVTRKKERKKEKKWSVCIISTGCFQERVKTNRLVVGLFSFYPSIFLSFFLSFYLSFFLSFYLSFFLPFVGLFFNVKQIIRKNQNCFLGQTSLALKKVLALDRKKQLQKSVTTALKMRQNSNTKIKTWNSFKIATKKRQKTSKNTQKNLKTASKNLSNFIRKHFHSWRNVKWSFCLFVHCEVYIFTRFSKTIQRNCNISYSSKS